MLSKCGKTLPYRKKCLRTPPLVTICFNNGLSIVKKNHALQHGDRTYMFTTSTKRAKKTRIRSSKQSLLLGRASVHMMRKNDLTHEEKETIQKQILYDYFCECNKSKPLRGLCQRKTRYGLEKKKEVGRHKENPGDIALGHPLRPHT